MKIMTKLLLLTMAIAAPAVSGQEVPRPDFDGRRLSANLFRAPSTGLDYRISNHVSAHGGYFPTILSVDGEREQVNSIRLGGTFWLQPAGSGFYLSTGSR